MRTIERDIVAAHVYSSDGRILIARNTDPAIFTAYGDCWKIPGGGVEPGETQHQATIREVLEETGIDISSLPSQLVNDSMTGEVEKVLHGTGEHVIAKMKFSTYKIILDKPSSELTVTLDPHEFNEYCWAELSELKNFKLSPPSVELFTILGFL